MFVHVCCCVVILFYDDDVVAVVVVVVSAVVLQSFMFGCACQLQVTKTDCCGAPKDTLLLVDLPSGAWQDWSRWSMLFPFFEEAASLSLTVSSIHQGFECQSKYPTKCPISRDVMVMVWEWAIKLSSIFSLAMVGRHFGLEVMIQMQRIYMSISENTERNSNCMDFPWHCGSGELMELQAFCAAQERKMKTVRSSLEMLRCKYSHRKWWIQWNFLNQLNPHSVWTCWLHPYFQDFEQ